MHACSLFGMSDVTGVSVAAKLGYAVLTAGGTTLDAVEAAVVSMENNPIFNAGYVMQIFFLAKTILMEVAFCIVFNR